MDGLDDARFWHVIELTWRRMAQGRGRERKPSVRDLILADANADVKVALSDFYEALEIVLERTLSPAVRAAFVETMRAKARAICPDIVRGAIWVRRGAPDLEGKYIQISSEGAMAASYAAVALGRPHFEALRHASAPTIVGIDSVATLIPAPTESPSTTET